MSLVSAVKAALWPRKATHRARVGVFDIDDVLVDCRRRTLALGLKFDASFFQGLKPSDMKRDFADTARSVGMSETQVQLFEDFCRKHFFDGKSFRHDERLVDTIELAQQLSKDGFAIRYLTGRTRSERKYTLRQLKEFGLPQVKRCNVFHKPTYQQSTTEFKVNTVRHLARNCPDIFHLTENRKETWEIAQSGVPVQTFLLQSKASGEGGTHASSTVLPFHEYDEKR